MEIKTIKIGRKEVKIKSGDYIQYNGACHLLCSGDGRYLSGTGWNRYNYIELTKKALSEFDLSSMRTEEKISSMTLIKRWYF